MERNDAVWDLENVKKGIALFANSFPNARKLFRFFGGEPLLEFSRIKELVAWSKTSYDEIFFDITTNGLLINKDICSFFRDEDKVELIISYKGEYRNDFHCPELVKKACVNFSLDPNLKTRISDFKSLVEAGFRYFNFLPAYYIKWQEREITKLRWVFDEIAEYLEAHAEQFRIKNIEHVSAMPLFGTDITMECDGSLYLGNFILDRRFREMKDNFNIGHISEISDLNEVEKVAKQLNYNNVLKAVFATDILTSTRAVDAELTRFCRLFK